MARRRTYPDDRSMSSRLEAISEALAQSQSLLDDLQSVRALEQLPPQLRGVLGRRLATTLEALALARRALTGSDSE